MKVEQVLGETTRRGSLPGWLILPDVTIVTAYALMVPFATLPVGEIEVNGNGIRFGSMNKITNDPLRRTLSVEQYYTLTDERSNTMGLLVRAGMAFVGVVVLSVYTLAAFALFLGFQWIASNPPDPVTAGLAFTLGVVVAAYVGYRLGSVRLVASLNAHELPRERVPHLYRRRDDLCSAMQVTPPPLLVADLGAPNALSIGGPRRGVVVFDRRLFRLLTADELEGILAHELAHMARADTFVNTLAITSIRTVVGLLFVLFLPFVLLLAGVERSGAWFAGRPRVRLGLTALFRYAVTLLVGAVMGVFTLSYFAYSRRQEYAADSRAVDATDNPEALARALAKIHRARQPRSGLFSLLYTHDEPRDEHPWLSTHPPIENRIERLLDQSEPVKPILT